MTRRRLDRLSPDDTDLGAAMAEITRLVRAGHSLASAVAEVDRTRPTRTLRRVMVAFDAGHTLHDSCSEVLSTSDSDDGALVLTGLKFAALAGGDASAHLEAISLTLDERRRARDDRRAQAAAATASTRLLTWLPVGAVAWTASSPSSSRDVLFGSTIGWLCLIGGAALNLAGRVWIERVVGR